MAYQRVSSTKEHEWLDVTGDRGRVGITDYRSSSSAMLSHIDLPEVGTALKEGQSFGTIESVKAVSELYSPVSGEVVEVNGALKSKPESVNTDPHGSWLILIRLTKPAEVSSLLDATQYADLVK
jgi:glycine cleavage system H protein